MKNRQFVFKCLRLRFIMGKVTVDFFSVRHSFMQACCCCVKVAKQTGTLLLKSKTFHFHTSKQGHLHKYKQVFGSRASSAMLFSSFFYLCRKKGMWQC